MFARWTKTAITPMFENEFETIASDIGSQKIVVRRANTRFALHWFRTLAGFQLLRSTRKLMIACLLQNGYRHSLKRCIQILIDHRQP